MLAESPIRVELATGDGAHRRVIGEFELEVITNKLPDQTKDSEPPDGGYGWICVLACFAINCFTWGPVSVSRPIVVQELG